MMATDVFLGGTLHTDAVTLKCFSAPADIHCIITRENDTWQVFRMEVRGGDRSTMRFGSDKFNLWAWCGLALRSAASRLVKWLNTPGNRLTDRASHAELKDLIMREVFGILAVVGFDVAVRFHDGFDVSADLILQTDFNANGK